MKQSPHVDFFYFLGVTCLPQRAALLKSMLNFLKKAIQDSAFSDSIRHVMDLSLPASLRHIISNAEYYGPSLFLLATDVVTAYVFQEPSLLSSLQDKGLTDVVLHALLVKDVPATREVLGSLPNVFSALCLNNRGLNAFVQCKPFERLFKVLLSPDYLPAMRRRRSSDPMGDTASNLGNAMDELMRHQPSLKQAATGAIIKLLEEVCALGRDPKYICWKSNAKPEQQASAAPAPGPPATGAGNEAGSSDEEDEEEEEGNSNQASGQEQPVNAADGAAPAAPIPASQAEKEPVPLVDYIHNVMKFVDAILSNNSTDDHCREFVQQKGLVPLMGILGLPNLPIDFPTHQACQSVAAVSKSILTLAHEPQVLKQGLLHLNDVLKALEPLHRPLDAPGGSVLLRELVTAPVISEATANPQVRVRRFTFYFLSCITFSFISRPHLFSTSCHPPMPTSRCLSTCAARARATSAPSPSTTGAPSWASLSSRGSRGCTRPSCGRAPSCWPCVARTPSRRDASLAGPIWTNFYLRIWRPPWRRPRPRPPPPLRQAVVLQLPPLLRRRRWRPPFRTPSSCEAPVAPRTRRPSPPRPAPRPTPTPASRQPWRTSALTRRWAAAAVGEEWK